MRRRAAILAAAVALAASCRAAPAPAGAPEPPKAPAGEANMAEPCREGVTIVESQVGTLGPWSIGVAGILAPAGGGPPKVALAAWRTGGAEDPPAFRGVVAEGGTFTLEGASYRVEKAVVLPGGPGGPGSSRSWACIQPL